MTALLEIIFFTMPNLFLKKLDRIEAALSEEKRDNERKSREKTYIVIPIIVILIVVQTIILYNLHKKGKINIQSASRTLSEQQKN